MIEYFWRDLTEIVREAPAGLVEGRLFATEKARLGWLISSITCRVAEDEVRTRVVIAGPKRESASELSTGFQSSMSRAQPMVAELPVPEEVSERYLEIRSVPDQQCITVIEILSPSNKIAGEGREQYERKRFKVLGSWTNLGEIDLVRSGEPLPMKAPAASDYRVVVSRAARRPRADVYLFGVRDPIPTVPLPLRPGEPEPELPLEPAPP